MDWKAISPGFYAEHASALLKRLAEEDWGQNLVEYTIMIGLVVLSIWVGVNAAGIDISLSTIWSNVSNGISR